MTRHRFLCVVTALGLTACSGGDAAPPTAPGAGPNASTTAGSSAAPSTASIPTTAPITAGSASSILPSPPTESVPTTSTPAAEPLTLLIVDRRGVRLWSEGGERRLLQDRTVGSALPDRVGGIVFQELETGVWRPDWSVPENTASWRWVGAGSPQPIRWLRSLDRPDEVVVASPADGWVQPVDTAVVDGHPTLAYVRTRYEVVTTTDENPWWASARAELVVHDLLSGAEQVVRTQDVGWEFDYRTPSLGEQLVADFVRGYGEGIYLRLWTLDGIGVDVPYELMSAVADLPPRGPELVQVVDRRDAVGEPVGAIDVTVIDQRSGAESGRALLEVPTGASAATIDTAGGRSVVLVAAPVSTPPPTLREGDRGAWVVVLQQQLDEWLRGQSPPDQYVAPDGVFGPRTRAAVETVQVAAGSPATGVADASTWQAIEVPRTGLLDPYVIEADSSTRQVAVFDTGGAPMRPTQVAPHLRGNVIVTVWSG